MFLYYVTGESEIPRLIKSGIEKTEAGSILSTCYAIYYGYRLALPEGEKVAVVEIDPMDVDPAQLGPVDEFLKLYQNSQFPRLGEASLHFFGAVKYFGDVARGSISRIARVDLSNPVFLLGKDVEISLETVMLRRRALNALTRFAMGDQVSLDDIVLFLGISKNQNVETAPYPPEVVEGLKAIEDRLLSYKADLVELPWIA